MLQKEQLLDKIKLIDGEQNRKDIKMSVGEIEDLVSKKTKSLR